MSDSKLLTVAETAKRLRVSEALIYQLARREFSFRKPKYSD
jgi:hypothetical protein